MVAPMMEAWIIAYGIGMELYLAGAARNDLEILARVKTSWTIVREDLAEDEALRFVNAGWDDCDRGGAQTKSEPG